MTREQTTSTNLRLNPEVRRRLAEFAQRTHRTLTASMNMLLTEALDAVDEANATDQAVKTFNDILEK